MERTETGGRFPMNAEFWHVFLPAIGALAGLCWITSVVAKRLRWWWIVRQLQKEVRAMDLAGIDARRRR